MRISDWSSDVCSSDLLSGRHGPGLQADGILPSPAKSSCGTKAASPSPAAGKRRCTLLNGIIREAECPPCMPGLAEERNEDAGMRQERIGDRAASRRSEEHTSELQSLMRISYAVFCLKKKTTQQQA